MLEWYKFIFSSLYIWVGTLILLFMALCVFCGFIGFLAQAFRGARKCSCRAPEAKKAAPVSGTN